MSYQSVSELSDSSDDTESVQSNAETPVPLNSWHGEPRTLGRGRIETLAGWTWDILLTLAPFCFFSLAVVASSLDGEPVSDYGSQVIDLTRLSPTIFPILFAAVASRFFKNISRWNLERTGGIRLGTLEQTFNSQSLAGAIESLLFVRTDLILGTLIVLIWSLSPLGGQSAVRLLYTGDAVKEKKGPIYFVDSRLQELSPAWRNQTYFVKGLYMACLIASPSLKAGPVDLWNLPKIPQWPKGLGDGVERLLDHQYNQLSHSEESFYTSWLGTHIQGLNITAQMAKYNFTIEKTYYDIDCTSVKGGLGDDELVEYIATRKFDWNDDDTMFAALVIPPNITETFPKIETEPIPLNKVPPARMQYITRGRRGGAGHAVFNCTVRAVVVDTNVTCNASASSTDCWATHQRRINNRFSSNDFPSDLTSYRINHGLLSDIRKNFLKQWSVIDSIPSSPLSLPLTDKYLAGRNHSNNGTWVDWDDVPLDVFSARLTTLFNTYWEASVNPSGHTNVTFDRQPTEADMAYNKRPLQEFQASFSQSEGMATVRYKVYRAGHIWVVLLVATTVGLQALAIAGVTLRLFIRGPEILGFTSSLTRENPYANISVGGTTLDGAERARLLRHLRVQLSDVKAGEEVGYIAFGEAALVKNVALGEEKAWRPLHPERVYR